MSEAERIRFYFSFRSPFAWFAAEQLEERFEGLDVEFDLRAIYPSAGNFPNDPTLVPNKARYFVQDMLRNARRLGLEVEFPESVDIDWSPSHVAAAAAVEAGGGVAFVLELYRKRWSEGADISSEAIIAEAAKNAGLDAAAIVAATREPDRQARAAAAWDEAAEEDGVFGVPSFVFRDKLYWGQDRMDFVRDAVIRSREKAAG